MAWSIEYTPRVVKTFKNDLDREIVRRMMAKLAEAAALDDPTALAKPMRGNLKGLWSYRIAGGYRVIADVQRDSLVILAVEAGPRRNVYDD